jgi:hypothetical protein
MRTTKICWRPEQSSNGAANRFRLEQSLALKCRRAIVAAERVHPFFCRHCQQDLPENYKGRYCPACGAVLPEVLIPATGIMNVPKPTPPVTEPAVKQFKINWWIFFAALLAPPLLTLIAAYLNKGQANEGVSPGIGLFGGAAGGIICGVLLALRTRKTTAAKVALAVLLSVALGIVCIMLSFFGCMVGGYVLKLE